MFVLKLSGIQNTLSRLFWLFCSKDMILMLVLKLSSIQITDRGINHRVPLKQNYSVNFV